MPLEFQLVIDAAEPHVLAAWWANALGWEVEPMDAEFIKKMVSEGMAPDQSR